MKQVGQNVVTVRLSGVDGCQMSDVGFYDQRTNQSKYGLFREKYGGLSNQTKFAGLLLETQISILGVDGKLHECKMSRCRISLTRRDQKL